MYRAAQENLNTLPSMSINFWKVVFNCIIPMCFLNWLFRYLLSSYEKMKFNNNIMIVLESVWWSMHYGWFFKSNLICMYFFSRQIGLLAALLQHLMKVLWNDLYQCQILWSIIFVTLIFYFRIFKIVLWCI